MSFLGFLTVGFIVGFLIRFIRDAVTSARFWKLNREFRQIDREIQEYYQKGCALNARAALKRLTENLEKQKKLVGFKEKNHAAEE